MNNSLQSNQGQPSPHGSLPPIPVWKRVLDVTLIILTLPVVAPVMILIAVVVRCVSAGPVLFRQERVGIGGSRFKCFKFRTMVVGNHAAVHKGHLTQLMDSNVPMTKMDVKGDPRIIPFGLVIRASGLDELPQLFNVFFGDMSLCGPRPCVPYEYEKYEEWQKERFNVLPGLTGLWQVSGKNNTTFEEMMELDIRYAKTSNPWMDLGIIFRTIPALIIQMLETRRRRRMAKLATDEAGQSALPQLEKKMAEPMSQASVVIQPQISHQKMAAPFNSLTHGKHN
jgi:lipopolysaccharide/colanic/teichoic acid biosynthesis glycosyltransferase